VGCSPPSTTRFRLRRFPDLELAGDPIPQELELFSLPVRAPRYAGCILKVRAHTLLGSDAAEKPKPFQR
jgi:hypothetical protein